MPAECSPDLFEFARVQGRAVVARFDGGRITSDAGALLLGATDRVLNLTQRLAACFKDSRDPAYTEHAVETLVMQRVVAIALGYEDLNDHEWLRLDPLLATACDKRDPTGRDRFNPAHRGVALAGASTLNRLELSNKKQTRAIAIDPTKGTCSAVRSCPRLVTRQESGLQLKRAPAPHDASTRVTLLLKPWFLKPENLTFLTVSAVLTRITLTYVTFTYAE